MKSLCLSKVPFPKVMLGLGLLSTTLLVRAQTQCVDTNIPKYFQPPNLAGFDVLNEGPWVLGDDFVCTNTGPINNIYLWGSWLNNNVGTITNFWLGIYDDVAANVNNPPPESTNSHPGNLLWQESFAPGQFVQSFYSDSQEQFLDPGPGSIIGTDSQAWEYCFYPSNPFTQTGSTTAPKIYWLVAYAQVSSPVGSGTQTYGWKTTAIVQNDISVHEPWTGSLPGTNSNWIPTVYQSPTGGQEPLDLAFKLETAPSCIDFTCPNNLVTYMPCGSSCLIITNYGPFFATNVCAPAAGVNVTFNPPPGSCFPLGTTPVTMTVSGSGETGSCTFLVTVQTNPNCGPTNNPPCLDIVCPTNLFAFMPCGSSCLIITNYPPFFATNVCAPAAGVNVTFNPPPGSCFPLGTTPVTMTVSGSGETSNCTFLVTVQTNPNCGPTNNPPCLDIVCPTNLFAYMPCGSSCLIIPSYPPYFATNVCAPSAGVSVTFNPPPGSCFPLGTTPVTMTVSGSGETSNCTFLVTVQTNPNCGPTNNPPCLDIVCPTNLVSTMPCGSSCLTITNYGLFFATNLCGSATGGGVTVTFSPPPGSCFPLGTTPVTMTVTGSGETTNCTFLVTVQPNPNCTTNPLCLNIVCPTNLVTTMPCGSSCLIITNYPPFFATNVCAPSAGVTVTFNPPPGSCFPLGTTPVTMTASGSGEVTNCTFLVTVLTNTNCGTTNSPPCLDIVCPTNLFAIMPCGSSCLIITNYGPFFATNFCGSPAGGGVTVTFNPPPGSCFPLGTTPVTMTASGSGETTNCTFLVTVQANTNCPPPVECVESDYQKYVQVPNTIGGYDVWNVPYVLADDFVCTNTGPISDIHLWGSWNENQALTNSITFWLGIYNNVPAGVDKPYSHPGTNLLWQQWFSPGQYAETIWTANAEETFMDPGHTNCIGSDSIVWYYCFYPTNAFEQLGTPTNHITYWLAAYATNVVQYGWKTTTNVLNDVSVHANWPGFAPTTNPGWQPTYSCISPTNGLDLAFKLTMCSPVAIKYLPPTNVIVTWKGGGFLQSATNVMGPYLDIPSFPSSPFIDYSLSATNKFYRLRCY